MYHNQYEVIKMQLIRIHQDLKELKRINENLSLYIAEMEEIEEKEKVLSRLRGRIKIDLNRMFYKDDHERTNPARTCSSDHEGINPARCVIGD